MDALSDVLNVMRLKGGVFLHAEFSEPWCLGVRIAPETCAPYLGPTAYLAAYHFVLEGQMRVRMPDGTELGVGAGQSVLFPRNTPHILGSDLGLEPVPGDAVVQRPHGDDGLNRIVLGGGGARTRIVCGFLGSEIDVQGNPVVAALPDALELDFRDGVAADWVRGTFSYAAEEIAAGRAGASAVMAKLSELLLIEAIRRYVETLPSHATGWLAALRDPFLARALARLHAEVASPWTVDSLARSIGLSRSALADRFTRMLDTAPMQYLTAWRLQVAARELLLSAKPVARIAAEVGYASEAAFTRAFKRALGCPPTAWRRRTGDEGRTNPR